MLILGIETSGRDGRIALHHDGTLLAERLLEQGGRRHAQTLVAEIDALLRSSTLTASNVDGVAVSIGPGSFTGLRVGVVCAKTFAYAVGCPLAAVDTLEAVAENARGHADEMFIVADAQRDDLHVGRYTLDIGGRFTRLGPIEIVPAEAWCAARQAADFVSGPGVDKIEGRLAGRCRAASPDLRHPLASVICRLAERDLNAGNAADLWTLEPHYVRKSAAEEKWDERSRHPSDDGPSHPQR